MRSVILWVGLVGLFGPAWGQYKCTGPDGKATYQDRPCTHDQAQSAVKIVVPRMKPAQTAPNPRVSGPVETDALTELYRRWIDADRLAASTARIALAQPVEKLQAIAREAAGMRVEPCAERALSALQRLTSASSEGMLEFMLRTEVKTMVNRLVDVPKLTADFEWQIESANCPSLRPGQASPRQP